MVDGDSSENEGVINQSHEIKKILVGGDWNMNFIFPNILGMSSSQFDVQSFFRGVAKNHQPDYH